MLNRATKFGDDERAAVLSLGAGVQSSVLLLMAAHGDLEERGWRRPDVAVMADTGWERRGTYEWLPVLRDAARRAGIELVESSAGNLRDDVVATARGERRRCSNPPLFVRRGDGAPGMIPRGCTRDYKIAVQRRALRERGFGPKRPIVQYVGFSVDEWERMKPSDVAWADVAWPLIDLRMTRRDCAQWLTDHGYPSVPSSSCVGCPLRSDQQWREMKLQHPDEFAEAVEWDHSIRQGLPGLKGDAFLHRSLRPLDQVDLRTPEDRGQLTLCDAGGCGT